jgi:hypothetical protein
MLGRTLIALLLALVLTSCSSPDVPGIGGKKKKEQVPVLAAGTCWSAASLGADESGVRDVAEENGVDLATASAVMGQRPAFAEPLDCAQAHALEVYRLVELPGLTPRLTSYGVLLRTDQDLYVTLSRRLRNECMEPRLARAAARTGLPGVVMDPALPAGMHLEWAPPSPEQFAAGQRGFACLFTQSAPGTHRYATVFTRDLPTALRTCILSRRLRYVDCARKHDRERIAVLQVRQAVLARRFPGRKAIRKGPQGRYLAASAARYAALDRACTTYLRSISTTKKLTGIAEIDLDFWPAADGSYPIVCEASTPPNRPALVTRGSVYDRR